MPKSRPAKRGYIFARFLHARVPLLGKLYGFSKRGFPFMWANSCQSEMQRLRAHVRRNMYAHYPPLPRHFVRAVMLAGWPFGALIDTLYNLAYSDGPRGVSALARRGGRMLAAALHGNVMPLEYVVYRLHEPDRRGWMGDYLYWSEDHVFRLLNAKSGAINNDVQDKARFAEICRRHDLPCIPTLAAYRGGRQLEPDASFTPEQEHIWVKDLAGKQGQGAAEWRREKDVYRDAAERMQTPQQLATAWQARNCIVQPFVRNHPALHELSCGLLVSARILTGIDKSGEVHLITHDITLPWGGWDNKPSFMFAKVGEDGRIARAMMGNSMPVERHPDSGALILGAAIPFWNEALELALRAHREAFPRFVFLGWDVAFTDAGPLLIETNSGPGVFHHQQLDDIPLGHTEFPRIALQYLES